MRVCFMYINWITIIHRQQKKALKRFPLFFCRQFIFFIGFCSSICVYMFVPSFIHSFVLFVLYLSPSLPFPATVLLFRKRFRSINLKRCENIFGFKISLLFSIAGVAVIKIIDWINGSFSFFLLLVLLSLTSVSAVGCSLLLC